jgi:hypothetical protein
MIKQQSTIFADFIDFTIKNADEFDEQLLKFCLKEQNMTYSSLKDEELLENITNINDVEYIDDYNEYINNFGYNNKSNYINHSNYINDNVDDDEFNYLNCLFYASKYLCINYNKKTGKPKLYDENEMEVLKDLLPEKIDDKLYYLIPNGRNENKLLEFLNSMYEIKYGICLK